MSNQPSDAAATAPDHRPLTAGQKFRILHTEWSDGWGGQERRIHAEMLGMRARGHTAILAARPGSELATRSLANGMQVRLLPFRGKFDLKTIYGLYRLIRDEKIDIVNTHSGIDSWVAGMAARLADVCLVRTRHLNLPLKRSWHNFVHFLPHKVVTCGQAMLENLRDNYDFPAEQLASIPTGIDFSVFRPKIGRAAARTALGLKDTTFTVLMAAVIRAVKRHEVAILAFAEFHRQAPDSLLLLAGEGPMRAQIEAQCAQLGIGHAVRFLGHREDIPDLMAASDAMILTSRSEGVPQVITQALGIGLPVVASAVGGIPELVLDGKTGLLTKPEDFHGVAAALLRLSTSAELRESLIKAEIGRAHV